MEGGATNGGRNPRTTEAILDDYANRREGLLTALTQDVEKLYGECNPERENLCLYGMPDGGWAVDLPAEEVPPELPEPTLGINFARYRYVLCPQQLAQVIFSSASAQVIEFHFASMHVAACNSHTTNSGKRC